LIFSTSVTASSYKILNLIGNATLIESNLVSLSCICIVVGYLRFTETSSGKKFANYWLHNEHLLVDGKKMSKSLGNFYTLRDLLEKGYNAKAIRYLLLSVYYRQQLNFTKEAVEATENAVQRLDTFVKKILEFKKSRKGKQDSSIKKLIEKTKKILLKEWMMI
jgi:cysteinyl-tRNA synthetase|tara:strand:+ start:39577 stop:40065 length:489 start_codon:yes stop_codon:yes gene_type:complete